MKDPPALSHADVIAPVIIKHPLTSQDRLVKELRLQNISTMVAANAYAPTFIADYKCRFAKPPRNDFNEHRPVSTNEDLNNIKLVIWNTATYFG